MYTLIILKGLMVGKAFAISPYQKYCNALGTYCGDGWLFLIHLSDRVANALIIPLIGGIAVIAVLWAGIKLIISYGNDQGKEDAKKIISMAVMGVAFSVIAVAVVRFVCLAVQVAVAGSPSLCG